MKANSSYRMSKQLKTMLANMSGQTNRNEVKRMMIEAEVAALRFRTSRRPMNATTGNSNEPQSN